MSDTDLVLVTGASGYLGAHIVKNLLQEGYRVRGTVRSLSNEVKVGPLKRLVEDPKHPLELVEADLLKDDGWSEAVKDCTLVLHVACFHPNANPDDENDVIEPSLKGTLRVLNACVLPDSKVRRVVYTSSAAAIYTHQTPNGSRLSEKDWPDPNIQDAVPKSKTLAEKAAWDFVRDRKKSNQACFELAVVNPGIILGPVVHDSYCASMEPVKKLLEKQIPAVPSISFPSCDVRDLALAHLRAMVLPDAANNRHIICTDPESTALKDFAQILDKEFKPKGYSVPTRGLPSFLLKAIALVDRTVAAAAPYLDKKYYFDNTRMRTVLKIEPRPFSSTLIDMANSMIEKGHVVKK